MVASRDGIVRSDLDKGSSVDELQKESERQSLFEYFKRGIRGERGKEPLEKVNRALHFKKGSAHLGERAILVSKRIAAHDRLMRMCNKREKNSRLNEPRAVTAGSKAHAQKRDTHVGG